MKKFEFLGEALCLDFLNTLHDTRAEDPEEELSSDADVAAWAAQAGIISASEAERFQVAGLDDPHPFHSVPSVGRAGQALSAKNALAWGALSLKLAGRKGASRLDDARALRETLRRIFQRAVRDGKIVPRDVETLNQLLERLPAAGRIERSNGDWTMNWESQAGGAEKIFYAIVKSAAELVATCGWREVRECASETCTWMFLDTSKNHSRRWCDMARCGNRDKVQRFRARSRPVHARRAVSR